MTEPVVSADMVEAVAEKAGVCVRPLLQRMTDTTTGETSVVPMACGSTNEAVCPACAGKALRVRMQQCREGWHLADDTPAEGPGVIVPDILGLDIASARNDVDSETSHLAAPHHGPVRVPMRVYVATETPSVDVPAGLVLSQTPEAGHPAVPGSDVIVVISTGPDTARVTPPKARAIRSTRHRKDFPDLPKVPMGDTTVGKALTSPTGKTYRPSMFLTLTLPSYGKVHTYRTTKTGKALPCACGTIHRNLSVVGTPLDPATYDYRRAALDAMHFPKLVDRWWQNLRRCAGYNVQYFAAVEPQKRLALHLHAAVRGIVARSTINAVAAATYEQLWWPTFDRPVYAGKDMPYYAGPDRGYIDQATRAPLQTWDQAMTDLADTLQTSPETEPAHLLRFGAQVDYQWVIPDTDRSEKRVGYITKYLTKSISASAGGDTGELSTAQRRHLERLHEHTRWLPCKPECANWLRFGIQPHLADKDPELVPGQCSSRAHQVENVGHGGRRALVSRQWSGKRLAEHRADRAAVVRAVLAEAGIDMPDQQRCSTTETNDNGEPRYQWKLIPRDQQTPDDITRALWQMTTERQRWKHDYDTAKTQAAARAKARAGPPGNHSPNHQPANPPTRRHNSRE